MSADYLFPATVALCLSILAPYWIILQNLSLPYVLLSQAIVLSRVTPWTDMT
jgi:hypothetical protein